ncbi:hypothetical protein H0H87_007102 [Tephrocybe sp. NHM501043]|nr:hypothetical protein H0H87_007102 [Tephrocybe sp. NHM501043]
MDLPLDQASIDAIASTARNINDSASSHSSSFDLATLILSPPSRPTPPPDTVHYLTRLARAAHADALAMSCSSLLAGQGSESDDTGDVALWLGSGDFASPDLVLAVLGLLDWAAAREVKPFPPPNGPQIDALLGQLHDVLSFRVSPAMTGGMVMFFLVGRLSSGGWGGLAGIGTWS